jgi:hypothetical protein
MDEELIQTDGMSRRDMLKRSAIVGGAGAMVWAAPSLTTFAPRAFGSEGTPASDYSNFGAVIRRLEDQKLFKIKANQVGTLPDFEWEVPGELGGCEQFVPDWDNADGVLGSSIGATFVQSGSNYIMTIPNTYKFEPIGQLGGVEAAAASLKQGQCCIAAVKNSDQQVTWVGPFPNGSPQEPCDGHPQNLGTPVQGP